MHPLEMLREECLLCKGCGLHETRTQVVSGHGDTEAKVMFIGEGPGEDEDERGMPFVGPSGRFFNMMLKNVHASRNDVWVTNTVLCRPTSLEGDNRVPTAEEMQACLPRLQKEICLVDPDFLVLMGDTAVRALCPHLRGRLSKHVGNVDEVRIPVDEGFTARYAALIQWHPSYLLRVDAGWEDSGPAKQMTDDLRTIMRTTDLMELMRDNPEEALSQSPPLPDRGDDITVIGKF